MWTSVRVKKRSISQKTTELKTQRIAGRGHMIVPPGLDQFEPYSKCAGKSFRIRS
jgi:hypothetical protein